VTAARIIGRGVLLATLSIVSMAVLPAALVLLVVGHVTLGASEAYQNGVQRLATSIRSWRGDARAMGLLR
jgi:hypothetical protein